MATPPGRKPGKASNYERFTDASGNKWQFIGGNWKIVEKAPAKTTPPVTVNPPGAGPITVNPPGAGPITVGDAPAPAVPAAPVYTPPPAEVPAPPAAPPPPPKPPATAAEIIAADIALGDSAIGADLVDSNRILGFGFGNAGGYVGASDIFGGPAGTDPGTGYVIRDAMGRTISADADPSRKLMESDVYAADGSLQDIAGTQLGDTITASRRDAANRAEGRSSRGTGAGGIRNAENTATGIQNSAGVNSLLGKFASNIRGFGTKRLQTITDSQNKRSGDTTGYVPPASTPETSTTTPTTPTTTPTTTTTTRTPQTTPSPNANQQTGPPKVKGKKVGEIRRTPSGVRYKWNGKNWIKVK